MKNVIASFEYVDRTNNLMCGADEAVVTRYETTGELYRHCLGEYGRCVGKCYVGDHQQIGWVFQKRVKYDDSNDTYIQETWVSVHEQKPEHTHKVIPHYATL